MSEKQAVAIHHTMEAIRRADVPAFFPLLGLLHCVLLLPFFRPAAFTLTLTPALTAGDLQNQELLRQRLRDMQQKQATDLLFPLCLVSLRGLAQRDSVDVMRDVPLVSRSHL